MLFSEGIKNEGCGPAHAFNRGCEREHGHWERQRAPLAAEIRNEILRTDDSHHRRSQQKGIGLQPNLYIEDRKI
jgi:hypothetical protein